jgi:WD40 repeat protein
MRSQEIQITDQPRGHILTNANVWSPDSEWIVYDTRSDRYGDVFDGRTIEVVNVRTKEVRILYRSKNGAHCGVATFSPAANKVVFIVGPENPTPDWSYSAWHRQGITVDMDNDNRVTPLEARNVVPPFTPGALRGGTHVHVFSGDGRWVSFTYEDHVLAAAAEGSAPDRDVNQRNVGVSALIAPVSVPKSHPRNHDAAAFSVLVTRTVNSPSPASDQISRAFEETWIGSNGYRRQDGVHQHRALAFQGQIVAAAGQTFAEVFVVDIPDDITSPGDAPLEGTETTRPAPPRGTSQRRLTFTTDRKFPGLQGPRHWLRSSPDGSKIAFLMRDDAGIVQLWTISPNGGPPQQITRNSFDIGSAFTWSPTGRFIAHVADNSIFVTEVATGNSTRLTERRDDSQSPLPQACVFSPDGKQIAFVRPVSTSVATYNQVFVVKLDERL